MENKGIKSSINGGDEEKNYQEFFGVEADRVMTIHFFVCRHGFGHLKRVMSVARQLVLLRNGIKITIHCGKSIFDRIRNWSDMQFLQKKSNVFFSHELMENSPVYDEQTSIASVQAWLEAVSKKGNTWEGINVLDNDASLVSIFPDAVLMGSFLWSEVLIEKEKTVSKELALQEINLLKEVKPAMLCIGNMATSGVREFTQPVLLPWFCEEYPNRSRSISKRQGVLITAGGTSKQVNSLTKMALELRKAGLQVFADSGIHLHSQKTLPLFSYNEDDFSSLRMVICRPGMGIINDCVRYGLPLLAVEEKSNSEMRHNAEQIEKLGLGKRITEYAEAEEIIGCYNSALLDEWQQNILKQETGGAKKAAEWLLEAANFKNKELE